MRSLENNLNNVWMLPFIRWAIDNKYLSLRAKFDTEDGTMYKLVSYILKNYYKKIIADCGLPGQVKKIGSNYVYLPFSESDYRWGSLSSVSKQSKPWCYFKHTILRMSDEELRRKPDFVQQLVRDWRTVSNRLSTTNIDLENYKYCFSFQIYNYQTSGRETLYNANQLIHALETSTTIFCLLKEILDTFEGI